MNNTKITPQIKDKVWKSYTQKSSSKSELKNIFLGTKPTEAYSKIKLQLKNELNKETSKPRDLKPTIKITKLSKTRPLNSPRSPKKSLSLKKSLKSPRSPKKSPRSPKKSPRSNTAK